MTGSIILNMAFGYSVKLGPKRDELLTVVEEATHSFIISTAAGAFPADTFPFRTSFFGLHDLSLTSRLCTSVRCVPAWFPGASFQVKAREWRALARRMLEMPYAAAKEAIVGCRPWFQDALKITDQIFRSRRQGNTPYPLLERTSGGLKLTSRKIQSTRLSSRTWPGPCTGLALIL